MKRKAPTPGILEFERKAIGQRNTLYVGIPRVWAEYNQIERHDDLVFVFDVKSNTLTLKPQETGHD
jgi:hypothetical protein